MSDRRQSEFWGKLVFSLSLAAVLFFFWWLLVYGPGVAPVQ